MPIKILLHTKEFFMFGSRTFTLHGRHQRKFSFPNMISNSSENIQEISKKLVMVKLR